MCQQPLSHIWRNFHSEKYLPQFPFSQYSEVVWNGPMKIRFGLLVYQFLVISKKCRIKDVVGSQFTRNGQWDKRLRTSAMKFTAFLCKKPQIVRILCDKTSFKQNCLIKVDTVLRNHFSYLLTSRRSSSKWNTTPCRWFFECKA